MVLVSEQFDDIYFSPKDGMAETEHVFLNGNNLPDAWAGRHHFVIAETGFGTGLNFLCAWKLFEQTATPDQRLSFVSVEKYPLHPDDIRKALEPWRGVLGDYIDRYLDLYPLRVAGPHKIYLTDRVTLILWIGDIADVMPQWNGFVVDAWFLDGFTPAKNPEMWTPHVFENMARLSHGGTSYASFTSASFVRHTLESVGFSVEKTKGFRYKREMIRGQFTRHVETKVTKRPQKSLIIGGGLAGAAMAHIFSRYGIKPVLLEAGPHIAAGASGGERGMIDPKLTARRTAYSDYYTAAYANAMRVIGDIHRQHPDIDFACGGGIHLQSDDDKQRRFTGYRDNLGWHADHLQLLGAGEVVQNIGMESPMPVIHYCDAGAVSPKRLSRAMAMAADVVYNARVDAIEKTSLGWLVRVEGREDIYETDALYICNGFAAQKFIQADLELSSVRGQVTYIRPTSHTQSLRGNFCFGGYLLPVIADGYHILGSSFAPWSEDISILDSDHADNIARLNDAVGYTALNQDDVVGGWAALRTSNRDRFPFVGQVGDNLFLSTAHNSHGIMSSLLAADILVSQVCGDIPPVPDTVLKALNPFRFV